MTVCGGKVCSVVIPILLINWSSEKWSHLAHVTQHVSGGVRIQTQTCPHSFCSILLWAFLELWNAPILWWTAESNSLALRDTRIPSQHTGQTQQPLSLFLIVTNASVSLWPISSWLKVGQHFPISFNSNISYVSLSAKTWVGGQEPRDEPDMKPALKESTVRGRPELVKNTLLFLYSVSKHPINTIMRRSLLGSENTVVKSKTVNYTSVKLTFFLKAKQRCSFSPYRAYSLLGENSFFLNYQINM